MRLVYNNENIVQACIYCNK